MRPAPLRFQRPSLPSADAIERYLTAAREERWFSNSGPCWYLLRDRLRHATGAEPTPVVNATLGLVVAIAALRDRAPRRATKALVPSFSFAASAQCAVWNGLEPVFVDVHPQHWHLAPEELGRALERRRGEVAVVIALSSFGTPPPPNVRREWEDVCRDASIPLVVDSAAGFGAAATDGTPIGAQGDAEVVSFHAVKPLAIGEGGAVFARDPEVGAQITRLTQFGFDENREVTHRHGINAKLSEPAAAIALAALDDYPAHLQARRAAAENLVAALPAEFEQQADHHCSTWQFVPTSAPSEAARDAVLRAAEGTVEIRTYYHPLHRMPAFRGAETEGDLRVTEDLARRALSLPMADDLTAAEIDLIADTVERASSPQTPSTL